MTLKLKKIPRGEFTMSFLRLAIITFLMGGYLTSVSVAQAETPTPKQWTFLIFINGKNNLDPYGAFNINQMETIGSTANINVVVQYASESAHDTKRYLIHKDNDLTTITSPVVQDLGANVDMGDWNSLKDFITWGAKAYPAQHYFVDVWDHGNGWHRVQTHGGVVQSHDISYDDDTGHVITTKQLGQALVEASKTIGQKIDIYGSDACLMAMPEVAAEMKDVINVYTGSEETEPDNGWPYDVLLKRWSALTNASATDIGKILTEEYVKSYAGDSSNQVTFSAFDMSKFGAFEQQVKLLSANVQKLSTSQRSAVMSAAKSSRSFTNADYVDFIDFLTNVKTASVGALDTSLLASTQLAAKNFVIAAAASYDHVNGLSMWIPTDSSDYDTYKSAYQTLVFDADTNWGAAIAALFQ
jgi:hypothetical protein